LDRGPQVIAPPPLLYLSGLAVGLLLEAILPSASVPAAVAWPLGGILIVVGSALGRSFFRALHRAGTPISPYRGATTLVTTGPYRLSCNPGYLGMAIAYAGIAVVTGWLWALVPLAAVLVVIDRGVIAREERYLEWKFGGEYRRYRDRTRRWL
jgi:protein-S-isoprenylcysteine O-methyltransferase Ste14